LMMLMNAIFKKLNFKDQDNIVVLNAPGSFKPAMAEISDFTNVSVKMTSKTVAFLLAFVTKQKEVDDITNRVAPLVEGDGILWFAYPKATSKNYKCEFNRDTGWAELGKHGFEGVRMVAIDQDWSALRFRKAEHIKSMTRSFAMSEEGKKKVRKSAVRRTSKKN
jgi:hypothetical protein